MKQNHQTRRNFLRNSGYAVAGALATAPWIFTNTSCQKRQPPNIIFLLTDDQRWDSMGCMGNQIVQTPNLDGLAREGVLFKNAFVTTAICCISRASIFTGQYARRHGILDFAKDFSPEQLAQTYPSILRRAGYRTGFIGKYGVGANLPAAEFDYWKGIPGQPKYEQTDESGKPKHLTKILGEQAIEFLSGCSTKQPFCLSISFKAPHVQDTDPRQFIFDPIYQDLYDNDTIPIPKTATEDYFKRFPEFFTKDNEARRRWQMRFSSPEFYQKMVKGYYRLITGMDTVVGRIRQQLAQSGLAENTVIIFTSDNGFFLGEHGLAGKWYGYEESIRVPLIIYDPRLPHSLCGQVRAEMTLNIDLAPTMLELAGQEVPEPMQGQSLVKLIRNQPESFRQEFFYEHLFDYKGKIPKSEGVVTNHYKYLRYIETNTVYEELYDLKADPFEETNLIALTQYQKIVDELRKRCDAYCVDLQQVVIVDK